MGFNKTIRTSGFFKCPSLQSAAEKCGEKCVSEGSHVLSRNAFTSAKSFFLSRCHYKSVLRGSLAFICLHLVATNCVSLADATASRIDPSVGVKSTSSHHLIYIHKLHEITQDNRKNSVTAASGTDRSQQHLQQPNRMLHIYGNGFKQSSSIDLTIRPTFSDSLCDYDANALQIINRDDHNLVLSLDEFKFGKQNRAYLCATDERDPTKLRHLGTSSKFDSPIRKSRSTLLDGTAGFQTNDDNLRIDGLRVEHTTHEFMLEDNGIPNIYSGSEVVLRLFGTGFTDNTVIAFTEDQNTYGGSCIVTKTGLFRISDVSRTDHSALFQVVLPLGSSDFYICAKNDDTFNSKNVTLAKQLVHQGSDTWLCLKSYKNFLPIWASILIIIVCLTFSALFSGLNLGLMSLDRTELKILRNTGTDKERKYASEIQPVRDHGNYLLCSILLGNVLVNSTFTILLDGLTSGLIAIIFSTLAIVVFGEITPQAICSRHGLAVGAKTIYITKAVMMVTFPLSYPTSKILDFLLGEEIGNVYNRERLKELVRVTTGINDLDKDEVNIISGALELRKKTVGDVMTHIEDAFMLSLDAVLDFETVSEIMKSGFSRIPVYEEDRKNIVTLLYIKDLAFVDPDDNTPLKTLCEFYQNPCHFVFEDLTLDVMFKQFKEGHKGHMAFVHRVNSEGDGDPFYETIGLVTLEDVIEELIQAEIMDETDVFTDNRTKVKRQRTKKQDFTVFAERRENQNIRISPQLTLATFQYLSTTVDAFKHDMVSETILRRLLNQDIIHHLKCKGKDKTDPSILIYQQGKPVDFFVLILEGRVEVTVGRENLVFESGPFTFFGTQALVQNVGVVDSPNQPQQLMGSLQSLNMDAMLRHTFVPDYSVRAVTDVIYVAVKRTLYLAAKRATLMERSQKIGESGSEPIDDEVEKLLHSLDEDDRSIGAHTANLNTNTPKNQSKPGSNTPSPTFPSVSINLTRKKNQIGQKNDLIMYAKEIVPNGPTPVSLNSLTNSFNQPSSQRSNSLANPSTSGGLLSPVSGLGGGGASAGSGSGGGGGSSGASIYSSAGAVAFSSSPAQQELQQGQQQPQQRSSTKGESPSEDPADTPLLTRYKS